MNMYYLNNFKDYIDNKFYNIFTIQIEPQKVIIQLTDENNKFIKKIFFIDRKNNLLIKKTQNYKKSILLYTNKINKSQCNYDLKNVLEVLYEFKINKCNKELILMEFKIGDVKKLKKYNFLIVFKYNGNLYIPKIILNLDKKSIEQKFLELYRKELKVDLSQIIIN